MTREDVRLVIPTYRRMHAQHTWKALWAAGWGERVTFAVDDVDAGHLRSLQGFDGADVLTVPVDVQTIADKRAFLLRWAAGRYAKLVMFDDDLRFAVRRDERLVRATPRDVAHHLKILVDVLDVYVHAGWSARQGNNRLTPGFNENVRMMYVLGYQPEVVVRECELGRIQVREDMDYTLQLLRRGYPNGVSADIACDQEYNAPGGASLERTREQSDRDAERLAELHPGLVRVVQRQYKSSPPRKEVVVQWKKAYASAP